MPRSLADPLHERLLRSFPADQAYTRADWEDDTMPDPVAHFLNQLLRHYSRREARRLRRARSDWVDYDHPDMEEAVRTFFNKVEAHTRVPAEAWDNTLRQATHHTTAHLVRPIHVLTDFVYAEREKPLRMPEVLWRMNFFGPYSYLREAVHAFSEKREIDALAPDRFERFLRQIDERITASYGAKRWLRLLDPLFETARRATGRERVPVSLLETFFAEKGHASIEQTLSEYARDHEEVGPKALHRVIEEAEADEPPADSDRSPSTDEQPPVSPEQAPPEPARAEPDTTSDDDIWGVAGTAQPEGSSASTPEQRSDESVPLWKQFQQGRTGAASPQRASTDGPEDDGGSEQKPLWARFRRGGGEQLSGVVSDDGSGEAAAGPSGSTPSERGAGSEGGRDLNALEREALGVSDPPHRAVYVRQLFGGDQMAYRQVLQRLAAADSWGEASQIIAGDVFRAHKVNIYSDAAVHFTNAVESRFRE